MALKFVSYAKEKFNNLQYTGINYVSFRQLFSDFKIIWASENKSGQVKVLSPLAWMATKKKVKLRQCYHHMQVCKKIWIKYIFSIKITMQSI